VSALLPGSRRLTGSLLTAALLACTSVVPATTDYDPNASFDYRTFMWLERKQAEAEGRQARNPWVDERIRSAIDEQLASQGFRAVKTAPDFRVGYHVSLDSRLDASRLNARYGHPVGWGGSPGYTSRDFEVGTLIIDIVDARSDRLVWRGWAARRLPQVALPDDTDAIVRSAVAEILAQFPPDATGDESKGERFSRVARAGPPAA
jgi:hypothetical protein